MEIEKAVDIWKENQYNNQANASVAQSVVHLTRNEKVACSSHVTSSTKSPRAATVLGLFYFIANPLR